jgi:FlaA1/EpsC-like NDP-sugar epimerase
MNRASNFNSKIYNYFQNNKVKDYFTNMDYLPRWIIFCIDISIVVFVNIFSYWLFRFLHISFYNTLNPIFRYGLVVLINGFFFLFFKTYSGILRHSTFIDGIKLLYATMYSFLLLVVINYSTFFITGKKIYVIPALFINLVIVFSVLFLFRIFVKFVFENFMVEKNKTKLINTLIYGADANAISVVNALNSEKPLKFKVLGFIDKDNQNTSKRILDVPILNSKRKISVIMRSVSAEALIISDKSLTNQQKLDIVEECLEYNFKVFIVPSIANWEDKKEIANKVTNFKIEDLLERNPIVLDNKLISKQLKNKTILITGAAGSIGSEIARQVINFNPKKIIILDQAETPLHHLKLEMDKLITEIKIKTVICDIRNKEALNQVFINYKPQVVFHAAAYKHVPLMEENPAQAIFVNVMGTKNTTDLSVEYGVESFVMISTDKAVNPSNVMGASKRIAEKYVQSLFFNSNSQEKATKFITTRFGNVLGSNGSVVPLFKNQIASGGPITITHPDIIRYFMTIPEACQLVLEAGSMGNGGEIFIFDMGKPVKIIDLANKMIRLAGLIPDKDIEIKIVGLRPGEKLYEELLNDTSKTLPTHHEKIMIAEELKDDFESLMITITELIAIAHTFNSEDIVSKMKLIVPEFISMNSNFESLDN